MDIWILFLQFSGRLRQQAHAVGLSSSDRHVAHDVFVRTGDLLLCLLNQREDLLRPAAQNHALLGEYDFPGTLGPPDQQLFSQILLHPLQLGGQGGLGDVQGLRRCGDALLPGHS